MLSYILEVTLCWGVFYFLYWLLLSRETFFHFNRCYLLCTFALSLLIPKVSWRLPQPIAEGELATLYLQPITIGVEQLEITVTAAAITPGIGAMDVLTWLYWLGVAWCALRFAAGMAQIIRFYWRSERHWQSGYELVLSDRPHAPFSFFRQLFLSKAVRLSPEDRDNIMRHELAHIRGGHSYDVLLVELVGIIFWCSPLVGFYRRSLRNVHEYIADAAVLRTTQRKQYGHLLIRQSQSGHPIAIANHFHSQLKKRILMMMRNPSRRRAMLKYLLAIPLTLAILLMFSNADAQASLKEQVVALEKTIGEKFSATGESTASESAKHRALSDIFKNIQTAVDTLPQKNDNGDAAKPMNIKVIYADGEVLTFLNAPRNGPSIEEMINPFDIEKIDVNKYDDADVITIWMKTKKGKTLMPPPPPSLFDEAPVFRGCETIANAEERRKCSDKELMMFIYKNIKYPAAAREKGIQGTVYVRYIVDERGHVVNITIQKGIGGGCDEEVVRLISALPNWQPARKDSKPVSATLVMPVNFQLDGVEKPEAFLPYQALRDTITVFDPKTYTEQVVIQDWNNNKVTVVGYSLMPPPPPSTAVEANEVFKVVEEMPMFPGCEEIANLAERKRCADRKMLEFVYKNLRYPQAAREQEVDGTVVVSFIIEKDGSVGTPEIKRSVGSGCDEEVLRLIRLMQEQNLRWTPGKQRGREVRVQFILPVRFKLDGETKPEAAALQGSTAIANLPSNTLELKDFSANPNPTKGLLNVRFKAEAKPISISLLDVNGQTLFTSRLNNFDGIYNDALDLSAHRKGLMILQIRQGEKVFSEKIVLQ